MKKIINNIEPANSIIEAFGGAKALAKLLKISSNSPTYWRCKKYVDNYGKVKGTNGYIPMKHWKNIIILGRNRGINIRIIPSVYDEVNDTITLPNLELVRPQKKSQDSSQSD